MIVIKGTVASEGVISGEALVLLQGEVAVPDEVIKPAQRDRELARLKRAWDRTRREVADMLTETRDRLGDLSRVLGTYLSLLDDETIVAQITEAIRLQNVGAATAVRQILRRIAEDFRSLGGPVASYASEMGDLERRILAALLGRESGRLDRLPRPVVIIADELTPLQTVSLDRSKVLGFATDHGGPESHTAILARHLGIPALIGLREATRCAAQGARVIIDALEGQLIIDPDRETTLAYAKTIRRLTRTRHAADEEAVKEPVTLDGVDIDIRCNIDGGENARELPGTGAQGVGLFRTEFLFIGRPVPPDEATQAETYESVLRAFGHRPVTVRTMDFGADKFDQRVNLPREPNPALGLRGIRLSFERADLFRTQVRAILRASVHGKPQIMFPMVSDLEEFRRARALVEAIRTEMVAEKIRVAAHIPIGAMIEVPSAALLAGSILREADFLSLGTNDLTQYALAVDRTNARVADLFKPYHPAVCRLIRMTVEAGVAAGKPVSACGEMAGMPRNVPLLLGLGLRVFSVSPARLRDVVDRIRRVTIADCQSLASAVLAAADATEAGRLMDDMETRADRRKRTR